MAREQLLKQMENIFNKLEMYNKKKTTMGLDDKELERYCKLYIEYLELKLTLWDDIFLSYILPEILYDKAEKLYYEVCETLKWNGELLVNQSDIDVLIAEYEKSNKKAVVDQLNRLYIELKTNLENYYNDSNDESKELIKEIALLMSSGDSDSFEVVSDFLDYKFEVVYIILGIKSKKGGK